MVMEKYYQREESPAEMLWRKITTLHLSYLEMDESPQKMVTRSKLEDYINSYLCVTPHMDKFECAQTPYVLRKSASELKDFSGYKAAVGFDAIGRYAANLITKPWRREYRQIKMYSGFYKHEVESNLFGAEALFTEMGYVMEKPQVLVLRGPICPDKLISVSLDALIAYVECQILCEILKVIWKEIPNVLSWMDIISYRERYIGSAEELINRIAYLQQEATQPMSQMACPMSMMMYQNPQMACRQSYVEYVPANNYVQAPSRIYIAPKRQPQCYRHDNEHVRVPTEELIPLDYDRPDGPSSSSSVQYHQRSNSGYDKDLANKLSNMYIEEKPTSNSHSDRSEREELPGTYESWNYVFRNLESQGYRNDINEKGDLLKPHTKVSNAKKEEREKRSSKGSTYDNVAAASTSEKKRDKAVESVSSASKVGGWHCETCTFLNEQDETICQMCGKSKEKMTEEYPEVGGPQCKKCTFVNKKGLDICIACSSSLDNSPTYI